MVKINKKAKLSMKMLIVFVFILVCGIIFFFLANKFLWGTLLN